MDDPNITMKEYIRLEEEKALKRGKVFNWEIAKYGKIWYDEDIHDLRSVKTEFPTIAFNDELSSKKTLSCEPTISSLNNEIDFRISFNDFDDKDYTNLYVPFGIPFDPKRYYKDGDYARMLRRPRSKWVERGNPFSFLNCRAIRHMALPPRYQRHEYLRYEGLQYTDADIADFETKLSRIYRREIHRVQVFNFRGLPDLMAEGLSIRMLMENRDAQGQREASSVIVIAHALPIIDMVKLVRLQLCFELMTLGHGYPQDLLGRREVHEELLRRLRFTTWTVTSLTRMMDRAGVPYMRYSESLVEYERHTRRMSDGASTSSAPQQPDPWSLYAFPFDFILCTFILLVSCCT
ncbi:hypothetical protein Tco_1348907 [Tanacetum coccineum]